MYTWHDFKEDARFWWNDSHFDLFAFPAAPKPATGGGSSGASQSFSYLVAVIAIAYGIYTIPAFIKGNPSVVETTDQVDGNTIALPKFCYGLLNQSDSRFMNPSVMKMSSSVVNLKNGMLYQTVRELGFQYENVDGISNMICPGSSALLFNQKNSKFTQVVQINFYLCNSSLDTDCSPPDEVRQALKTIQGLVIVQNDDGSWASNFIGFDTGLMQIGNWFFRKIERTESPSILRIFGQSKTLCLQETTAMTISQVSLYNSDFFAMDGRILATVNIALSNTMIKRTVKLQSLEDLFASWFAFFGAICAIKIFLVPFNKRRFFLKNKGWEAVSPDFVSPGSHCGIVNEDLSDYLIGRK